ncbi:MAG: sulfite exporter TauE/SafE family protein [Clostridia bacterium]|nr:sulfite exporter TauE/SafE family protein [Clostridia bacterium]
MQKQHFFQKNQSDEQSKSSKSLSKKQIILSLICGGLVGFLNGFFGGGGGMFVVPILIYLLGLNDKQAHATAIFVILPISVASSVVYLLNNSVNFFNLSFVCLGFVVGGILGAILLAKINNKVLRITFAIIMIIAGIKMLF